MTPMSEYLEARDVVADLAVHILRRAEIMRQFADQFADKSDPYWRVAEADALNEEIKSSALRLLLAGPPVSRDDLTRVIYDHVRQKGAGMTFNIEQLRDDLAALYQGAPK